ncbi:MAG TPA: hypothetical protein VMU41_07575 [Candidatus Binataceae bacterium]|nr:hypothetical protein [Candidatus Binataceae bacterium]
MTLRNVTDLFADDSDLTRWVKRRPLTAVALGAAVGFVWGGGAGGKFGRSLLFYAGQAIVRETVANAISDAIVDNGRKRSNARG